jgi:hypothetical protein
LEARLDKDAAREALKNLAGYDEAVTAMLDAVIDELTEPLLVAAINSEEESTSTQRGDARPIAILHPGGVELVRAELTMESGTRLVRRTSLGPLFGLDFEELRVGRKHYNEQRQAEYEIYLDSVTVRHDKIGEITIRYYRDDTDLARVVAELLRPWARADVARA